VRPRPEQEVVRHERRRLGRRVGVVPRLQPGVDRLAGRGRAGLGAERLDGDRHAALRGEEDEVREVNQPAAEQACHQVGPLAVGPTEGTPPQPAGPHQHQRDARHGGDEVGDRPRPAELLGPVPAEPAGRPEDDVVPGPQRVDGRADGRLGAGAAFHARLAQVGHLDGVRQPRHGGEQRVLEVGFEQHRPRAEPPPDARQDVRRVHVCGVVRQDQVRPRTADGVQPGDGDAVSQHQEGAAGEPDEQA
jgi:hypothetical protein